jgi:hypothetical protein
MSRCSMRSRGAWRSSIVAAAFNREFAALLGAAPEHLLGASADGLALPLHGAPTTSEQTSLMGDLVLIERHLSTEPLVGLLLQLLPRRLLRGALPPGSACEPSLTTPGILARDVGLQRLANEISRSRRYDNPLSCLIGRAQSAPHHTMPRLVDGLARLLKDQLRWVDVLVQWDAGSILAILPETGADAVTCLQHKLRASVVQQWPEAAAETLITWGSATWRRGDEALRLALRAEASAIARGQAASFKSPR